MNKLIPVITVIALLTVTLFVMNDSDDSEALTDGNWTYSVIGTGAVLSMYDAQGQIVTDLTIPSTVTDGTNTYSVLLIGDGLTYLVRNYAQSSQISITFSEGNYAIQPHAFENLGNNLKDIHISSTITNIGASAFANATGMTELVIPDTVTTMGDGCFQGCSSLTSVKLSSGTATIPSNAFNGCTSLTGSLVIPEGVSSIGQNAFYNCIGIDESIVVPSTLTSIGNDAFTNVGSINPIPVLYNSSSLNIVAGSQDYGQIARYVTTVENNTPPSPTITSTPSYVVQIGDNWTYTVTYTGINAVLTATYPSWITLSGDTLSGANAPGGTYHIDITVTDAFGRTDMQSIDLTVTADYIVAIESSNTAYGTVDRDILTVPYNTPYSVSGDKLTIGSTVITATPTPTVVGDQYSYSLIGWNVSSGTVTGNMSIIANFEQTVREYTVTIGVNDSSFGTVNTNSVTVPYGSEIIVSGNGLTIGSFTISATPSPSTAMWDYSFVNWSGVPSDNTVRGVPIEITAQFEQSRRLYDITINIVPEGYGTYSITRWDGSADVPYEGDIRVPYGTGVTSYGDVILFGTGYRVVAVPSPQEVEWTYAFDSWTIPSSNITGDMTINVNFTRTANTVVEVTVTTSQGQFYEGDNAYTSHVFRVPIPSSVSQDRDTGTLYLWNYEITADMTVSDELYDYTFFIWEGVPIGGGSVSDGMTISAIYHSEDRYYEVNFSIADGFGTLTTDRVLVLYNTLIAWENNVIVVGSNTITATPTPDGDGATYEFVRWDGIPMSGRILEDTDISAKIQRTVTANAFNIVEIEHGDVERVWSIPDEYLPLMLVIPVMLLIGMVLLSLNRKSDGDDYESY